MSRNRSILKKLADTPPRGQQGTPGSSNPPQADRIPNPPSINTHELTTEAPPCTCGASSLPRALIAHKAECPWGARYRNFATQKQAAHFMVDVREPSSADHFHVPVDVEAELSSWWRQQAEDEIARTAPKAAEYGSRDLIEIGRDLARAMGLGEIHDQWAAELGIYFYLRGKLARWTEAVVRGETPSDDTLFDIGVYVRMAQRVRAAGGWPTA